MEGDKFCNNAEAIYIRLDGLYYYRIVRFGWRTLPESALPPGLIWSGLHEKQRAAYLPALVEAKLLAG